MLAAALGAFYVRLYDWNATATAAEEEFNHIAPNENHTKALSLDTAAPTMRGEHRSRGDTIDGRPVSWLM